MQIESWFWVILDTFSIIILSYCSSKMKTVLKRLYWLKLLNLGFNKINFPQSNPVLDTWEQNKSPTPNPKTQPHHQNYAIYFLWRVCKKTGIIFVLEQLQVSYTHALNKSRLEKFIFITHTKKPQQTSKVGFFFTLTESLLLYYIIPCCIFLKYLN